MTGPHPEPANEPPSGDHTRIIRRAPTGPIPAVADDTRTGIIRRVPTGTGPPAPPTRAIPAAPTAAIPAAASPPAIARPEPATGLIPRATPAKTASPATAVAACVVAIISGWATCVVATSLITGWWNTDRLFCLAVGFLALVFIASTVTGIVLLLLRRPVGRYLIAAGSVVALLGFGGVFIAGAKIPWAVYAIPALPVIAAALALLPATKRWATDA